MQNRFASIWFSHDLEDRLTERSRNGIADKSFPAREMKMRALVVDDSRTVRIIVGNILREMGAEVIEADNGLAGLDQLRLNSGVQLILVDWNMPEMNGLEFIQAVRAKCEYDEVRIMMVTTETDCEQVSKALRAGANEYMMKPFTKDVLVAKLNMLDVFAE